MDPEKTSRPVLFLDLKIKQHLEMGLFTGLTAEVITKILEMLDEVDLSRMAQCCKGLNKVVDDPWLWKRLYNRRFEYDLPVFRSGDESFRFKFVLPEKSRYKNPWRVSFIQFYGCYHIWNKEDKPESTRGFKNFTAEEVPEDEEVEWIIVFVHARKWTLDAKFKKVKNLYILGAAPGKDVSERILFEGRFPESGVLDVKQNVRIESMTIGTTTSQLISAINSGYRYELMTCNVIGATPFTNDFPQDSLDMAAHKYIYGFLDEARIETDEKPVFECSYCMFKTNGHAIKYLGPIEMIFESCWFVNNQEALNTFAKGHYTLNDCHFLGNRMGIDCHLGGEGTIANCVFENNRAAISIGHNHKLEFEDNQIKKCRRGVLYLDSFSNREHDRIIKYIKQLKQGNQFSENVLDSQSVEVYAEIWNIIIDI